MGINMLKRSSIVKGEITPKMIEEAGRYIGASTDVGPDVGALMAETIAEMWTRAFSEEEFYSTSGCTPSEIPESS